MRFNAHHSPIGAYATFTLGATGNGGGFGLEAGLPPSQDIVVGIRTEDGALEALPFFHDPRIRALEPARRFGVTVDEWEADDIALRVLSPLRPVPEPGVAPDAELRDGLLPAVLAELTFDNRAGGARRACFGLRAAHRDPGESPWGPTPRLTRARAVDDGFVLHDGHGRMAGAFCRAPEASSAAGDDILAVLDAPPGGDGSVAALRFDVPAGSVATYRLAIAFWHGGVAAEGPELAGSYWYTRLFAGLDDVARHALDGFDRLAHEHAAAGAALDALPEHRRFQLAHAIRSYYGNTALLAADERPLWAVIEGEFMFVNTLDLTVDQMFFELRQSPWTVRNVLDRFRARHCFEDGLGVSFTHDMGAFPHFAPPASSAYERRTHMTTEELINWTLTALGYIVHSGDRGWAEANADLLERCLRSLVARAPGGVPGLDTDRLPAGGEEITTYDSLGPALRRARGSSYLTGKVWAACAALAEFFSDRPDVAQLAWAHAERAAAAVVAAFEARGRVPALLDEDGDAVSLAAAEGLAFARYAGAAEHPAYADALRAHVRECLQSGACRFPDGGWRLSSADDNSWLSKVYIAQFVAEAILGLAPDAAADAAHAAWLCDPEGGKWAWSDQILAGRIHSSRYYPRGVTGALWLG